MKLKSEYENAAAYTSLALSPRVYGRAHTFAMLLYFVIYFWALSKYWELETQMLVCGTSITHLTRRGRVTHIFVSKQTSIGSHNGLSPDRRQAMFWVNAGILLIGPLKTF